MKPVEQNRVRTQDNLARVTEGAGIRLSDVASPARNKEQGNVMLGGVMGSIRKQLRRGRVHVAAQEIWRR